MEFLISDFLQYIHNYPNSNKLTHNCNQTY
uniref:Uncharacterized protein n=1 Tax=Rhizophora mucronata TaxID=61149 RepID=A0A2P2QCA8_RHIMU